MSASPAVLSPASRVMTGRAASIERRLALSAGKAALPPAAERVRNGERTAALPSATGPARGSMSPVETPAPAARVPAPAQMHTAAQVHTAHSAPTGAPAPRAPGGRAASIERRLALSAGKSALPPAAERVRNGERSAALPAGSGSASGSLTSAGTPATSVSTAKTVTAAASPPHAADVPCAAECCNSAARARRTMQSLRGRGSAPAAPPTRPPREGRLQYAPKVVESVTQGRQTVTGSRIGNGSQVTGVEPGANLPISGTQYIGREAGLAAVPVGPKVGLSRTPRGGTVSGTLIRSNVAITGDEAGGTIAITGEAEQRPEDDLTERKDSAAHASAQFQRQADPHGQSVFGTNLGRSLRQAGSRARDRSSALEMTERGLAITGSAVGRASRMTGDEDGSCRQVTGDQYLSPARLHAACGGAAGVAAPAAAQGAAAQGAVRIDPVTGAKVRVATTWGQQSVTGSDVEHDPRVTGDMQGSCSVITGTHYHGPRTLHAWCEPEVAAAAGQQLPRRAATTAVTGDTPLHDESVTGMGWGVTHAVTGTPYYSDVAAQPAPQDAIAALHARFSVPSPQRAAQLRAQRDAVDAPSANGRITGPFAIESKKLTGNLEFAFKPRNAPDREAKPGRALISGEGRTAGRRISGDSWAEQKNVTGTEGFTAVDRNPSERNGKPHTFAGASKFKSMAVNEEQKQLVTGMAGWSSSSAAKVTLSGGAHG